MVGRVVDDTDGFGHATAYLPAGRPKESSTMQPHKESCSPNYKALGSGYCSTRVLPTTLDRLLAPLVN
jgi:hypothetical protein